MGNWIEEESFVNINDVKKILEPKKPIIKMKIPKKIQLNQDIKKINELKILQNKEIYRQEKLNQVINQVHEFVRDQEERCEKIIADSIMIQDIQVMEVKPKNFDGIHAAELKFQLKQFHLQKVIYYY